MMVMYEKDEFEAKLVSIGLTPTEHETDLARAWVTKTGKHVLVPKLEPGFRRYFHFQLEKIQRALKTMETADAEAAALANKPPAETTVQKATLPTPDQPKAMKTPQP